MNKRFASAALAAASLPAALALTATPAQAQDAGDPERGTNTPACGAYPPGQQFRLRVSPSIAQVSRNAVVRLSTRLVRGNDTCAGRRVGFYQRFRGRAQYNLVQNTNPTTDGAGLRAIRVRATDDFRFFANYSVGRTLHARSATGLVQVRR